MAEEVKNLQPWQEVIVDFLSGKKDKEEEEFLKKKIKEIGTLFEEFNYYENDDIKYLFDTRKCKKSDAQTPVEFQRERFNKIVNLAQHPPSLNFETIHQEYHKFIEEKSSKYEPHHWINEAASKASNVSFATHVTKLTHSKIDSPSFFDCIDSERKDYVTTASLRDKIIDGTGGNQYAPIHQFLNLELNGQKLANVFSDSNNKILQPFVKQPEELSDWNAGFKKSISEKNPSSHALAKQVYFPVDCENEKPAGAYHLLSHVKSSTLAQAIFEKLFVSEQKSARKLRKDEKYSDIPIFSNVARLGVTASNPGNASQLNGKRGGKLYLLSCHPPNWQSQLKPPVDKTSLFDSFYPQIAWNDIDHLRNFLIRFKRIDLSIRNPERRKWIEKWVGNIIDELLNYVINIQNLTPSWSNRDNIRLKIEHQYFLDPYRGDADFLSARKSSDWKSVVCDDFARWLNVRLTGKDKQFTPKREHRRMWASLMEQPLREHDTMVETDFPVIPKETP